ncbi:hypothetical protein Ddc_08966 [Ditylenchus destructor]|nr:hypothetical protein Ddc_08966 [Ditylenchus destructor]
MVSSHSMGNCCRFYGLPSWPSRHAVGTSLIFSDHTNSNVFNYGENGTAVEEKEKMPKAFSMLSNMARKPKCLFSPLFEKLNEEGGSGLDSRLLSFWRPFHIVETGSGDLPQLYPHPEKIILTFMI